MDNLTLPHMKKSNRHLALFCFESDNVVIHDKSVDGVRENQVEVLALVLTSRVNLCDLPGC